MTRQAIGSGRSCLECRRRKIKCDRDLPCAYCVRTRVQCMYPPPRPDSKTRMDDDLSNRVRHIECALRSLERNLSHTRQHLHLSPPLTGHGSDKGYHLSPELEREIHPHLSSRSARADWQQFGHLFPFYSDPAPSPVEPLHPPSAVISFIWQTYLDVVDPVLKIFHAPTVQRVVVGVIRGRLKPDSCTECLMFAVYYATVVTMSAAECHREFNENKVTLLKRHRTGVEDALRRADFLKSLDMRVLQAFVLYLICGRRDENGPDVCSLVGIAIGTAMKIGLHCDGGTLNLSPFETEMRRRLWWQICILDVRIAEDNNSEPTILDSSFTTALPLNVNDTNLDPDMSEVPSNQSGRTEMLFSLVRFEVSRFARQVVFSDNFCQKNSYPIRSDSEKCRAIDQFRGHIENQYLMHCDKNVALDFVTAASNRLILVKLKLAVCRPRPDHNGGSLIQPNYQKVCEEILQHAHTLRQYDWGKQWLWLSQTYFEWDALACLLLDLCMAPSAEPSSTVWRMVDEIYNHWKNDPDTNQDRRWKNIEELRWKAFTVRDRMQTSLRTPECSDPESIIPPSEVSPAISNNEASTRPHQPPSLEDCSPAPTTAPFMRQSPATEPSPPTNQFPSTAFTDASTAMTSAQPQHEDISTGTELPGTGTACEWSAEIFGRYWDIAGPGQQASVSWL